jgi:competence protein ComEA
LPGVGPGLASAILRVRNRLGGRFRSVEDLREVQGIGQKRFDRLRPLVRVD